jgi:ATP-dependent Lon protease
MTRTLPILPLRDIVVFPQRIVPLFVGREKSVAALEAAMADTKELFLVAQLDPTEDDPDRDALYDLGVIATAMQLLKLPDGTVRVLVEGVKRARLVDLEERDGFMTAKVAEVAEEPADGPEAQALMRSVIDQFENYAKLNKRLPPETGIQLGEIEEPSVLADAVASNLSIKVADKQALLGELNPARRMEMVFAYMEGELGVLQDQKKIRSRDKRQM